MTPTVRSAKADDTTQISALLLKAAQRRNLTNAEIWPLANNCAEDVRNVVHGGIEGASQSPEEFWHVAEVSGEIVGVSRAMILPIPPIYAGLLGLPGLILDDFAVADGADPRTGEALLQATEVALTKAGAGFFLVSKVACDAPRPEIDKLGYAPLTLYFAKADLETTEVGAVRPATTEDVSAIVAASAKHRKTVAEISRFWIPHVDADSRFANWMEISLTLKDRDMMVVEQSAGLHGYVIAQPIAGFLVPAGHEKEKLGVIDDFYDGDFSEIEGRLSETSNAVALLSAAESALDTRGFQAAFVVCPAGWPSKRSVLVTQGYGIAKTWFIKAEGKL